MFTSAFGLQLEGGYDMLTGIANNDTKVNEDKNVWQQLGFPAPIYFETNVIHGSLKGYVNLSNLALTLKKANQKGNHQRRLGIYTAAGVGLAMFDSKISDLGGDTLVYSYDTANAALGVGGYLRGKSGAATEFDIPWSLGIKYKLGRKIDIGLDNTVHFLLTDKLDGYSDMAFNGPSRDNDRYMVTSLSLTYKFVGADPSKDYIEWTSPEDWMYDDYQQMAERIRKLSTDTDNDGVSDIFDKEPATAAGNKVDGSGVSLDVDNDGVADSKDTDPFTPKGATVDENGKPTDTDSDGVPDVLDQEANTPSGTMVNQQGRTIRQDFATKEDLASAGGAMPVIFFDVNSSTIKTVFYAELAELGKKMKANESMRITVTGYTDVSASEGYNQRLGQRRADAVKTFLTKYFSIDAARIEARSMGEQGQLYKSHYTVNRRVEVDAAGTGSGTMAPGTPQSNQNQNQQDTVPTTPK
jgi:outer membrane protein OmpA-like peptidoglycan-associated protein